MGSKKIRVGDEFTAAPDTKITVVEYHSCDYIVVEDEEGNRRGANSQALRRGQIVWRNKDGSLRGVKGVAKKVNKGFWEKTANLKREFPLGARVDTKNDGYVEIVEVKSAREIVVRWASSGQLQTTHAGMLRCGGVRNPERRAGLPTGYYVYLVSNIVTGELLYVGHGKGERMRHALSGASHNRELNRLFFLSTPMLTEVLVDSLTKPEASKIESSLIAQRKPICNTMHNK